MTEYAVYSIDYSHKLRHLGKFMYHISKLEAGGKTQGKTIPCVGAFKGSLEHSFISTWEDYINHVVPFGVVENQRSVLKLVPQGTRYLAYDGLTYLGEMINVKEEELLDDNEGWTYRPDLDEYFRIKDQTG